MHTYSRQKLSLDGEWGFEIDQYDVGVDERIWEHRKERPDGRPENFDVDAFRRISVPGDWNRQFPELACYEGVAWYHRKVERPAGWAGRRVFLLFEAVNYDATVYWNGQELGRHEGGFTPFCLEITGKIEPENDLCVRVDSRRRPEGLPALRYDWFNYGGVTRHVWLVLAPRVLIRDFAVRTELGKKGPSAEVEVELDGAQSGERVRVLVPELDLEGEAALGDELRATVRLDLSGATLWSPQKPRLYRVEAACAGDRVWDEIGFRTVERKGQDLLLNGRPIFLRGVCLHEETPRVAGRTLSDRDVDFIFKTARALGANFLRLAHYPHSEAVARAADKLGVLLWEEIPVYWSCEFGNKRTLELARTMLRELVERDRNRASVVMWSVANETPEGPERLRFLKSLAASARELDPTRLVTAAVFASRENRTFTIEDPLAKFLDVVGVNEYCGWYHDRPQDLASFRWRSEVDRPVIVSEFGAGARAGLRGRPSERWTEDYQAEVYRAQLDMIERMPFVRGVSPWILFDFRSPLRMNRHQQGYNRKGLVSDQGVRKLAFQVLRERYESWRRRHEGK